MIPVVDALRIAEAHFPKGPEELIRQLGIEVRYSPLVGCDGWCLVTDLKTIIRVNESVSEARQRFTLAHELSHILLGIPTLIGETFGDFSNVKSEEKSVDKLASQILLPETIVLAEINHLPIAAATIRKLAKKAQVSQLVVALRIASLADQLGISGASVVLFRDNQFNWQWSSTITIPEDVAEFLLEECKRYAPQPFRHYQPKTRDVIVASLLENPAYGTSLMLLQLLPKQDGLQLSRDERLRDLADQLFFGDDDFRRELQGCFGWFKSKVAGLKLSEAIDQFNNRYRTRWSGERARRLNGPIGQEYIRLRLSEWCKN